MKTTKKHLLFKEAKMIMVEPLTQMPSGVEIREPGAVVGEREAHVLPLQVVKRIMSFYDRDTYKHLDWRLANTP